MRYESQSTTIASGASLSGVIALQGCSDGGIIAVVPTSCSAYLQCGLSENGTFARVFTSTGSAQFSWAIGSGNSALNLAGTAIAFPFIKIETSVAMTSPASFSFVTKDIR